MEKSDVEFWALVFDLMDGFDRLYELHNIFRDRRYPVSAQELMHRLECSRATLQRHIQHLRDYLGAPIRTVRGQGYEYEEGEHFELPGLWFRADELYALLAALQTLREIEPAIIKQHVTPLARRIEQLLEHVVGDRSAGEVARRIRVQPAFKRAFAGNQRVFGTVAAATLERQRLHIRYTGRVRNAASERQVSPQRLMYYRDNWYLDAWCHQSNGLRRFSLDRIERAAATPEPAHPVGDDTLEAYFDGYGAFGGHHRHMAVLRFSAERARWVADEQWHPQQSGRWLDDGNYELILPYSDPRELSGDILRHGSHVEVIAPEILRTHVIQEIQKMQEKYS